MTSTSIKQRSVDFEKVGEINESDASMSIVDMSKQKSLVWQYSKSQLTEANPKVVSIRHMSELSIEAKA